MAIKKPLVLNANGEIEQLQSGDSLASAELLQQTNGNAGALVICTPVYSSNNDTVDKARANAVGTVNVIGLMADVSTAAGALGAVQLDGILTASTAQWDVVTGGAGGLVKDTIYYLSSATAGKLASVAPTVAGEFVIRVGIAISTTELKIDVGPRIKL